MGELVRNVRLYFCVLLLRDRRPAEWLEFVSRHAQLPALANPRVSPSRE